MPPSSLIPYCSLLLALFLLSPEELTAQRRRQPPGPWAGELTMRSSILLDDEVLYAGARVSRELSSTLRIGLTLSVLTEEATRRTFDSMETIELLGSIGPIIEYADQLRSRVDYYFGLSGGVGYGRRRVTRSEGDLLDDGLFLVVEPEIGLLVRASRRLTFRIGLSGMAGRIGERKEILYGGPSATFGTRVHLW